MFTFLIRARYSLFILLLGSKGHCQVSEGAIFQNRAEIVVRLLNSSKELPLLRT